MTRTRVTAYAMLPRFDLARTIEFLLLTMMVPLLPLGFDDIDPWRGDLIALVYADDDAGWDSPHMAPFVTTPPEVVGVMLDLAEFQKGDVLYDLGSGDGRIVIEAAQKYGVKAVGFEIDPILVRESQKKIKEAGLEGLVEIREQDIRTVDFSAATVVTMYLYPAANLRLRSLLMSQLRPGSRVISHDFDLGSWKPARTERMRDASGLTRTIYLWRIAEPHKP